MICITGFVLVYSMCFGYVCFLFVVFFTLYYMRSSFLCILVYDGIISESTQIATKECKTRFQSGL